MIAPRENSKRVLELRLDARPRSRPHPRSRFSRNFRERGRGRGRLGAMQFQNTLWVSAQTPKRIARFCTHAAPAEAFSLIELMVVLALIAIVTALIVPEMKGTFDEALLRSTARQLVDALSLASSRAVTLNHPHLVRVDRKNGLYAVEETRRAEQSDNPLPPGRKAA